MSCAERRVSEIERESEVETIKKEPTTPTSKKLREKTGKEKD